MKRLEIQAAGFSQDGSTIAAVLQGFPQDIAMFNADTGQYLGEKAIRLSGVKFPEKISQVIYGPRAHELMVMGWGQAPDIINLRSGERTRKFPVPQGDQIMRAVMSPENSIGGRRIALTLSGRVDVYSENRLEQAIGQPIKFKGSIGYASFSADGLNLLTWSGPNWGIFSAVRLWSLEPVAELKDWNGDYLHDKEKAIAPEWLPDFAEAVIGQGGSSDEDGDLYPERRTLEDFAAAFSKGKYGITMDKVPQPYRRLLDRYAAALKPKPAAAQTAAMAH
jgi:hypothetical protein